MKCELVGIVLAQHGFNPLEGYFLIDANVKSESGNFYAVTKNIPLPTELILKTIIGARVKITVETIE